MRGHHNGQRRHKGPRSKPFDLLFTQFDVVEPDLLYVSNDRAGELLTEKHAVGADLVIEIGSPSTRGRDETLKLALYEHAGVFEYWFVDPEENVIRVYRRTTGEFLPPVAFSGPATLSRHHSSLDLNCRPGSCSNEAESPTLPFVDDVVLRSV
jgi:Uma2 family endonuclease